MKAEDMLLLGAVAVGGYFVWSKGLLSNLFGSNTTAPAAPVTGTTVFLPGSNQTGILSSAFTTPNQVISPGPNPVSNPVAAAASPTYTLGDIYTALQYQSADIGQHLTLGQWNTLFETVSNMIAPDASVVFPETNINAQMTLGTYWYGMSQWLAANKGMSGGYRAGIGRFGMSGWFV